MPVPPARPPHLIEVWVVTLVISTVSYMGSGPTDTLRIQLPREEQCVAVRQWLIDLNRLVPEALHVGQCTVFKKEEGDSR